MTTIKKIFEAYGPEYIERFGDDLPFEHLKVIDAIINCRTESLGATIYQFEECGQCSFRCPGSSSQGSYRQLLGIPCCPEHALTL